MSELSQRIVTALLLAVLVVSWYFYAPADWYVTILAGIGLLASWELIRLMGVSPGWIYLLPAAPLYWLGASGWDARGFLLLLFVWFAIYVWRARTQTVPFQNFVGLAWMSLWLLATIWVLGETHESDHGRGLVMATCLGVWASDIAAYFVGRRWGRRKLCPAISPGKSIEGLAAGLVAGAIVAAIALANWSMVTWGQALWLAAVAVAAGVLGDLSESALKRMVGAKDSGFILPGHGGILDRIDAIVMALPVTWLAWSML